NRTLARRMMERTKIFRALQGVRGQKAVDLNELETILVRFSQLLTDFPDIQEIDINPLLAAPTRLIALDARVLLAAPGAPRPQLAIHPYPTKPPWEWTLPDGPPVTIRVTPPEEEPQT